MSTDLLEEFDDAVWDRKVMGNLDRDADRSQAIRGLMCDFITETRAMERGILPTIDIHDR